MTSPWRRALWLALRPGALADDRDSTAEVLQREQVARGVRWRAGVLGVVGGGAAVMGVGVLAARSLERWPRQVTDGGWDFWMNVEHDLPWVGAALGGIFVLRVAPAARRGLPGAAGSEPRRGGPAHPGGRRAGDGPPSAGRGAAPGLLGGGLTRPHFRCLPRAALFGAFFFAAAARAGAFFRAFATAFFAAGLTFARPAGATPFKSTRHTCTSFSTGDGT